MMIREILFRAKRIKDAEWIEGDLLHLPDGIAILANGYANIMRGTICQYTGLTDKNGNKIWENDIVKKTDRTPLGYMRVRNCRVFFHKLGYWAIKTEFGDIYWIGEFGSEQIEVIGNIFDNPEFIEQRK